MTTRRGELSVRVGEFALLAKALRPPPDKHRGLTDVETRYRQRYVDLEANERTREIFRIRHAGDPRDPRPPRTDLGFTEVEGPVLQTHPGRRGGPAVRHPPQRPRHRPLPADRAGAAPQAAHRRRDGAGVRDRAGVPQRGHRHPAQPRVHDAGGLPGLRRLPRHDGPDRGPGVRGRAGRARRRDRRCTTPGRPSTSRTPWPRATVRRHDRRDDRRDDAPGHADRARPGPSSTASHIAYESELGRRAGS